jgi:hypothetical protein
MTIDGTDFCILQKGVTKKGNLFGPLKYAGKSVLQYELGINILAGNLVWIKGPYPAGAWNDIKIFMNIRVNCLQPDKRTKADNGHVGHAIKIKCPNNDCNPEENLGMQLVTRSHHETSNGRLKNWGILEKTYHHNITKHRTVYYACLVITQLSVANREPLFEVDYGNE